MICRKCRKQINDKVRFCPNCGTKVVDDREDLRSAMDEVFNEKKKKNDILTKIIIFLIVLIILVAIAGGFIIGKALSGNNVNPNIPPVVDNTDTGNTDNNQNDDKTDDQTDDKTDDKNDDVNNDQTDDNKDNTNDEIIDDGNNDEIIDDENDGQDEIIDDNQDSRLYFISDGKIEFVFQEGNIFTVTEFLVSKNEDGVRFDIKMKVDRPGNLYLMDNHSLSIGPIQLNKGNRSSYFIINGQSDYTLAFTTEEYDLYEYYITHDMIQEALKGEE